MASKKGFVESGTEQQIAVNHFGHFLLTKLLLQTLTASAPSRIIVLSSSAHKYGRISRSNLEGKKLSNRYARYAQSKLANIFFVQELARRLTADGVTQVTVNAVHPGIVKTNLGQHLPTRFFHKAMRPFTNFFFKSAKAGAQSTLRVALDPLLENTSGEYFEDCEVRKVGWFARNKDETARWLWEESERWAEAETSSAESSAESSAGSENSFA